MRKILFYAFVLCIGLIPFTTNAQTTSRVVKWTAVGDDGVIGTATTYDIRISTDSLALFNSFSSLTPPPTSVIFCAGEPIPAAAGMLESFTVTGLYTGIKYYVMMIVGDEVPNWSGKSNMLSFTILDTTPPAAVTDLR